MKENWYLRNKCQCIILLTMLSFIANNEAWAEIGVSIGSGYGVANIVPVRVGIQKTFEREWGTCDWPIGGYWEGSFYTMNGKRDLKPESHKKLTAAALAGVFRVQRAEKTSWGWPYAELGVGLSWLSQKEIGGRDLGMHFQFEDRIGLGVRFGRDQQYDISYRAIHFSNAYIGPCNHGINLHVIVLGYWFK